MRHWHCFVGGQQYGSVAEGVLRGWIAEGRVHPTDLVWTDGLAQWAPVASIPELMAARAFGPTDSVTGAPPPEGAGGQTPNRDLMRQARERLNGKWGFGVLVALVFILINYTISVYSGVLDKAWHRETGSLIGNAISLVLGGPLELGLVIVFLGLARGKDRNVRNMFDGFRNFGSALGAYILRLLLVVGWFLLTALPGIIIGGIVGATFGSRKAVIVAVILFGAVPGIVVAVVAALRYAMTFYFLADNPRLGALEPIRRSKQVMNGRKWKLFCLFLRFLGWILLCAIPMATVSAVYGASVAARGGAEKTDPLLMGAWMLIASVGFLWLMPYIQVSMARFYDDLRAPATMAQPAETAPAPEPLAPAPTQPF